MHTATAIFCRPFFPRHLRSLSLFACLLLAGMLGAPRPAQAQDLPFQLPSPNAQSFGAFGSSVAGVGDLDGDGVPDFLVGAYFEEELSRPDNANLDVGRAYAFSGRDGRLLLTLRPPGADSLFRAHFGAAVAGVGDLNSDGTPDLLVGAPVLNRAYVFSGRGGQLLLELSDPDEQPFGYFGGALAGVGDLNSDGVPDLLVGAPGDIFGRNPEFTGRAYAFSGQNGRLLLTLQSPNEEVAGGRSDGPGQFGTSVTSVGDLDGDDIPDLLIGARGENPGDSPADAGRAYAFSGRDGRLLLTLRSGGEQEIGSFGRAVAGPGDLDQDGTPDLVVGAPGESIFDAADGAAYVFSGRDGRLLSQLLPFNISEAFGSALAGVGDLNGDGIPDLVVGAPLESFAGTGFSGSAYVFSGKPDTTPPVCTDPAPIRENGQIVGVEVTASDPESGIDQIFFTTLTNNRAFVNDTGPYAEGDSVIAFSFPYFPYLEATVRAERIEPGVPAQLVFEVTNRIGLSATCDPVFLTVEGGTPAPFALQAPYPNPARGSATFAFALQEDGPVALEVFDAAGRRVAVLLQEDALAAGTYEAAWDGRDEGGRVLASGVYFARLRQGAQVSTQAVTLLR